MMSSSEADNANNTHETLPSTTRDSKSTDCLVYLTVLAILSLVSLIMSIRLFMFLSSEEYSTNSNVSTFKPLTQQVNSRYK